MSFQSLLERAADALNGWFDRVDIYAPYGSTTLSSEADRHRFEEKQVLFRIYPPSVDIRSDRTEDEQQRP